MDFSNIKGGIEYEKDYDMDRKDLDGNYDKRICIRCSVFPGGHSEAEKNQCCSVSWPFLAIR